MLTLHGQHPAEPDENAMQQFLIPAKPDLQAAREGWLAMLSRERRLAVLTLDAYERDTRQFLHFLTGHLGGAPGLADVGQLRPADLRAFLASRRSGGAGARTLGRGLAGVRSLLRYLERRGLANAAGAAALRAPKQPKSLPKPLTASDARRVVSAGEQLADEPWIAARNAAVLTLLYGSGLRISEALGLAAADLADARDGVIRVTGKGGKTRLVPVLPIAHKAVAEYRRLCPHHLDPQGLLFRGARGGPLQPAIDPARDAQTAHRAQPAGYGDAARAAPFLRHAPARPWRRSAHHSGIARPCQPVHDAGLHRRGHRPTARNLRARASARLKAPTIQALRQFGRAD